MWSTGRLLQVVTDLALEYHTTGSLASLYYEPQLHGFETSQEVEEFLKVVGPLIKSEASEVRKVFEQHVYSHIKELTIAVLLLNNARANGHINGGKEYIVQTHGPRCSTIATELIQGRNLADYYDACMDLGIQLRVFTSHASQETPFVELVLQRTDKALYGFAQEGDDLYLEFACFVPKGTDDIDVAENLDPVADVEEPF